MYSFVNNKYFSLVNDIIENYYDSNEIFNCKKFKFKFSNSDSNWIRKFWLKFFNSNQNSHFFQLSFSILMRKKTRRMKICALLNNIFIINVIIEFVTSYKLKKMNRKE